ncbi:hypothetical protein VFPPC_04784 [Pochonia chlamydosporia 170]|uniref:Uncharacterized protein n=1 Tax=Pochonia chlamydosporia 170 TaxID=1380566 RepID=A0A179FTM8_METCM|nr:hypothetical protein VFPPC_04784 [Pochonia chlamydosporia 170]OAQ68560.1 hypothetical protein VFPPC_04784 [Pochonia chlamydosporia 170]
MSAIVPCCHISLSRSVGRYLAQVPQERLPRYHCYRLCNIETGSEFDVTDGISHAQRNVHGYRPMSCWEPTPTALEGPHVAFLEHSMQYRYIILTLKMSSATRQIRGQVGLQDKQF